MPVLVATINALGASRGAQKFADAVRKMRKESDGLDDGNKKVSVSGIAAGAAIGGLATAAIAGSFALLKAAQGAAAISEAMIRAAADAQQVEARFSAVFKDLAPEVTEQLDNIAERTGRARISLREYAAGLQDVLVPTGLARDASAELSTQMVDLALDVAAFTKASDADVIRAFGSALTGEIESLKTYGIVIRQAQVEGEAYRLGIARQGEALDDSQKAVATYSLLLARTGDAQGAIGRSTDQLNEQYVRLTEGVKDLRVGDRRAAREGAVGGGLGNRGG